MENRSKFWIGAGVLLAGGIFWGVGQAVSPSGGDTEFQKALEAIKQVKSFRGTYIESASSTLHTQRLWEVDCNQVIVHQQSHDSQASTDSAFEMKEDELLVGDVRYMRDSSGSWQNMGDAGIRSSAKWYCDNVAQGTARDLLPDILTMTHHAMFEKGEKKTVNGVQCREWKFDVRSAVSSQKGSVCLGVDDHLPYEMTAESGARYSYSDYNRPLQIEVPKGELQPVSATDGSN